MSTRTKWSIIAGLLVLLIIFGTFAFGVFVDETFFRASRPEKIFTKVLVYVLAPVCVIWLAIQIVAAMIVDADWRIVTLTPAVPFFLFEMYKINQGSEFVESSKQFEEALSQFGDSIVLAVPIFTIVALAAWWSWGRKKRPQPATVTTSREEEAR